MTTSQTTAIRRIFGLLLSFGCILAMFFLFSLTGHAARATGTVKNRILNVRTEASTSSSIRCKLSQGTKVTILSETTGTDGMKWYNVYFAYNNDALEGYVRSDLVNVTGSSATSSSSGSTTSGSSTLKSVRPNAAIVRSYASTDADIRTRLYKGTIVTLISEKTGDDGRKWSKVSYISNGSTKEGYIRSDLLTAAPSGAAMTGTSSATASGSTSAGAKKYVNTNVAIVRTYASTNGDIRTRLTQGTNVTVIKTATGQDDGRTWYKVSYTLNGVNGEGYIRGDLLTDVTSTSTSAGTSGSSSSSGSSASSSAGTKATIKPLVANIRSYASTDGDIRSKLSQGTTVTIVSEKTGDDSQKWYKISYTVNSTALQGYIRGDLLTLSTGSTASGSGTSNSSGSSSSGSSSSGSSSSSSSSGNSSGSGVAEVMSYASPYADVRTTLANGTKVTIIKEVTGEDGEKWTKISFEQNGKRVEGYVKSSILK